ncbi:hypothetical protein BBP40_000656 [Aspergillus hancockii]|nr:hypothetical protein BBP40_000656 [Aspergillus hancockii]
MEEEISPLLGSQQQNASNWSLPVPVYLLSTCIFCLAGSGAFLDVPLARLIEDNLCRRYVWHDSSIDERLCKTDEIQSELAHLNGSLPLVEAVVGLLVAFPFGVLADRSQTHHSALNGIFSVQLILAGPLFNVVGGGSTVLVANLYSIATDLLPETDRASAFFLMAFASLSGSSVSPAVSSKIMESFSTWVAALIGIFTIPIGLSVLVFIPETCHPSKQEFTSEDRYVGSEERQPNACISHLFQSLRLFKSSFAILQSPSIFLVLATFLTRMPEMLATSQFLAQYVSKRFDWPLAKTGYLIALRGSIHMGVLLVALPLLSKVLLRWQRPAVRDLTFARLSAAFAATGALGMAASQIGLVVSGLVLLSLGAGLAPLSRSLATSYLSPQDTSKLNTLIGIVETVGMLFAGPGLAWLFKAGLKLHGPLIGLPYLGLAGLFVLCLVGFFLFILLLKERRLAISSVQEDIWTTMHENGVHPK